MNSQGQACIAPPPCLSYVALLHVALELALGLQALQLSVQLLAFASAGAQLLLFVFELSFRKTKFELRRVSRSQSVVELARARIELLPDVRAPQLNAVPKGGALAGIQVKSH